MQKNLFRDKKFILILLSAFFYFICITMTSPIAQSYTVHLGGSVVISGIASGMLTIGSMSLRPFVGFFLNRVHRKNFGISGLILMVISGAVSLIAPNPFIFILCRIIAGFGFAISSVAFSTIVADILPYDKVGTGMSIYSMAHALSMAIAPTMGLWLRDHLSYTAVFLVMIGCAVVSITLALLTGPIPNPQIFEPSTVIRFSDILRGAYVKEVVPIALVTLFTSMAYQAISSFLSAYTIGEKLDLPITLYFPVYAVSLFVFRLLLAKTLDRKPYGFFMMFCIPSIVIGLLLLTFMRGTAMMFLAAMFMGFGYGMTTTVSQTTSVKCVDVARRGAANSCYYIGMDIGLTISPFLAGGVVQLTGTHYIFLAMIPFILLSYLVVYLNRKTMFTLPREQP